MGALTERVGIGRCGIEVNKPEPVGAVLGIALEGLELRGKGVLSGGRRVLSSGRRVPSYSG